MSAAEPRYAEALYRLLSPEDVATAGRILSTFNTHMTDNAELRSFLRNPAIAAQIKKETALQLMPQDAPDAVKQCISLLIDRKRLDQLPGVCAAFDRIANRNQKHLDIRVTTARPLDDAQLSQIQETYGRRFGAQTVSICQETEPSLLGGIRVQMGDVCVDDTLRARLNGLRTALADYIYKEVSQ